MIWRVTKPNAVNRAKHQWHNWFAWYPVRVPSKGRMSKQHMAWCQTIRRRIKFEHLWGETIVHNFYCLPGGEFWPKKKRPSNPPEEF